MILISYLRYNWPWWLVIDIKLVMLIFFSLYCDPFNVDVSEWSFVIGAHTQVSRNKIITQLKRQKVINDTTYLNIKIRCGSEFIET